MHLVFLSDLSNISKFPSKGFWRSFVVLPHSPKTSLDIKTPFTKTKELETMEQKEKRAICDPKCTWRISEGFLAVTPFLVNWQSEMFHLYTSLQLGHQQLKEILISWRIQDFEPTVCPL